MKESFSISFGYHMLFFVVKERRLQCRCQNSLPMSIAWLQFGFIFSRYHFSEWYECSLWIIWLFLVSCTNNTLPYDVQWLLQMLWTLPCIHELRFKLVIFKFLNKLKIIDGGIFLLANFSIMSICFTSSGDVKWINKFDIELLILFSAILNNLIFQVFSNVNLDRISWFILSLILQLFIS